MVQLGDANTNELAHALVENVDDDVEAWLHEQVLASNLQMAYMAPQMRSAMQSPQFREIL